MANKALGQIESVVSPVAGDMGLEIVDVAFRKTDGSRFVEIFISRIDGEPADFTILESFHRRIADLLDEFEYDYLEVASPGDRPLKKQRDFERNYGKQITVKLYAPISGKKTIEGELAERSENELVIIVAGERMAVSNERIAQVRPLFIIE